MSSWQQHPTPNYPAPPYAAPARWYRAEGPAKALRVLMVLTIIALGLLAIAYAVHHSAYTSYDVGDGSLDTVQNADAFLGFASLLSGGLTIAVFVLTVIWQWRLAKNHQQLGRPGTSLGPGWAIGGWFIPLANFVLPFIQFRDLWRGADPEAQPNAWKQGRVSPVLWLWWGLFVGAYVIEMVTSFRLTFGTVEAAGDQAVGGPIAATVCRMVAGVFFLMVVGRLTERQERAIATTLATAPRPAWTAAPTAWGAAPAAWGAQPTWPAAGAAYPGGAPVPPPHDLSAGWKPDPTGRAAYRYWDGARWTEHASIEGRTFSSPMS